MLRKYSQKEYNQHIKNINILGYTKIENFIKKKYKVILLKKVIEEHKKINLSPKDLVGLPKRDLRDLRVYNLPERDKIFIDLISDYNIEKILKPFLNDPYYRMLPDKYPNYIISSFTARSSGYKLDLHIDFRFPFQGSVPVSLLILFVLEDMSEKNGATVLVPGSHLSGKYTDREIKTIKVINAKAGDVLVLDSRTWHGTTENKSKKSRWLINANISQWWLKQQVNIPNTIPKKIFTKLTNKQKQLLGYCSIPPNSELERINTKCGYDFLKNYNYEQLK